MEHPHQSIAGWAEPAALAVIGGVLLQVLPAIAALFAAIWYGFCMWESLPGKRWRSRWRGLYYHALRYPMPDPSIKALQRQLADMQHATDDRVLIAAAAGFAVALALLVTAGALLFWRMT